VRILVAATLVLASCTTPPGTTADQGGSKAVAYDVQVDASSPAFNLATVAYFPDEAKAHPGDTVRFTSVDRGEPHTVTFGTIIDDALAALAKVPKDAPPGPPPPAILKVPPALAGQLPSNIDLRQSAMQPCYLTTGDPPPREACSKEQQRQPEFTGTQSWFNGGFVPGRAVLTVKLAANVKSGTYNYICLFHGPEMTGRIVVVDRSETIPSPDDVKAKGTEQLSKLVEGLRPALAEANKPQPKGEVLAGWGDPSVRAGLITEFFPKTISAPAGGAVTWRIVTGHSVSFNAPSDAVDFVLKATDGSFHLNNKAVFPQGWPGQPLPPLPGLDPVPGAPPEPVPFQGPLSEVPPPFSQQTSWDGKGFRSSGIIFQFDPRQSVTYKVTFSQPGTYTYQCLIHVDMQGTVKVGP
jgi:plastocyanin